MIRDHIGFYYDGLPLLQEIFKSPQCIEEVDDGGLDLFVAPGTRDLFNSHLLLLRIFLCRFPAFDLVEKYCSAQIHFHPVESLCIEEACGAKAVIHHEGIFLLILLEDLGGNKAFLIDQGVK